MQTLSNVFASPQQYEIRGGRKIKQFCVQVETPPFTCHENYSRVVCEDAKENVERKNYTKITPLG
jgi:hypothetical protein